MTREELEKLIIKFRTEITGSHDFVQTSPCGRGQRHPHGLVGKFWRIEDPETVRVGDCFLKGRLKSGDIFLCIGHGGDCFQNYIYTRVHDCNPWDGSVLDIETIKNLEFGSYGIGDAKEVDFNISESDFNRLKAGGSIRACKN